VARIGDKRKRGVMPFPAHFACAKKPRPRYVGDLIRSRAPRPRETVGCACAVAGYHRGPAPYARTTRQRWPFAASRFRVCYTAPYFQKSIQTKVVLLFFLSRAALRKTRGWCRLSVSTTLIRGGSFFFQNRYRWRAR
jgi:hypothetical protein